MPEYLHTLNCDINTQMGGDHAYCHCSCHSTLPATPPSRQRVSVIKGRHIVDMLQTMRLVLCNQTNKVDADYHTSKRNVPYVSVNIKNSRYTFTFFGKSQIFRVFKPNGEKFDIKERNNVIQYFVDLNNA